MADSSDIPLNQLAIVRASRDLAICPDCKGIPEALPGGRCNTCHNTGRCASESSPPPVPPCPVCYGNYLDTPGHYCEACRNTGRQLDWPPSTKHYGHRWFCPCCAVDAPAALRTHDGGLADCPFCLGQGVVPKTFILSMYLDAREQHDYLQEAQTQRIGQPLIVALAESPLGIYTDLMPQRRIIIPARSISLGHVVNGVYDLWMQPRRHRPTSNEERDLALHYMTPQDLIEWSDSFLRHLPRDIWHPLPTMEARS